MATAVLALQGAFEEHERALADVGEASFELRSAADLARPFDRLVLPGGESTVQGKLLRVEGLLGPLRERIAAGMPVLGTCAGLILLARAVEGDGSRKSAPDAAQTGPWIGTLDVVVKCNAYGRQLGSFHTEGQLGDLAHVPMTFIRAPFVASAGPAVDVLATVDGRAVAVRQGAQIGLAFHPEPDADRRIHKSFAKL